MFLRLAGCLLALVLVAPPVSAQPVLRPVDEAAQQPDFFTFRAKLATIVARHDAPALIAQLADDVTTSFGGDGGIEEFRTNWKPEAPDSGVWEALGEVLALGGTFQSDGEFVAPYVAGAWPEDLDGIDHVALVGSGVRVRAAPAPDAAVLATLDFAILARDIDVAAPDPAWHAVRLPDGRTGYVDARFVRSSTDVRAVFAKIDGRWRLTALVAGD
jgi:hypothetical protein